MAAGDVKLVYGTASDATITLASLATDTSLLTGRGSTALDNTSNLFTDYLISGKITTGTSPTASRAIEVWAVGSWDGTNWPDVFDGTDSAETITQVEIKNTICRLVAAIATTNTSNRTYPFGPVSLAGVFGGVVPPKVEFFVTHSTGVNLNSTGSNQQIRIQPVYMNVAAS